jgi:S1-C subfamily serine protease
MSREGAPIVNYAYRCNKVIRYSLVGLVFALGLGVGFGQGALASTASSTKQANTASLGYVSGLIDDGFYEAALASLKSVPMATDAEVGEVFVEMSKLYASLGNVAKAKESLETAFEISPSDSPRLALEQARLDILSGNLVHARRSIASMVSRQDLESNLKEELRVLQARAELAVGGFGVAEQVLKQGPSSERLMLERAKLMQAQGNTKGAKALLDAYKTKEGSTGRTWLKLAELSRQLGDAPAATTELAKAKALFTQAGDDARLAEAKKLGALPIIKAPPAAKQTPPINKPPPLVAAPQRPVQQQPPRAIVPIEPINPVEPVLPKRTPPTALAPTPLKTSIQPFPFPPGSTLMTGSGFVIDGGRRVVTNKHVVHGTTEIYVRNSLGDFSRVRVERVSETDDLAILVLDSPFASERAIAYSQFAPARAGANIAVLGFPLTGVLGSVTPSITNGIVIKDTGMQDDPKTFQLSAKMNKGNSGGAVVDARGKLIGIAVGKLDIVKMMQDDGFLPEDINFAVHVNRLQGLGVSMQPASVVETKEMPLEEIYQRFIGSVVMVAGR